MESTSFQINQYMDVLGQWLYNASKVMCTRFEFLVGFFLWLKKNEPMSGKQPWWIQVNIVSQNIDQNGNKTI